MIKKRQIFNYILLYFIKKKLFIHIYYILFSNIFLLNFFNYKYIKIYWKEVKIQILLRNFYLKKNSNFYLNIKNLFIEFINIYIYFYNKLEKNKKYNFFIYLKHNLKQSLKLLISTGLEGYLPYIYIDSSFNDELNKFYQYNLFILFGFFNFNLNLNKIINFLKYFKIPSSIIILDIKKYLNFNLVLKNYKLPLIGLQTYKYNTIFNYTFFFSKLNLKLKYFFFIYILKIFFYIIKIKKYYNFFLYFRLRIIYLIKLLYLSK